MTSLVTFQFRRGLSSLWQSANTVLAQAEPGYEIDTGKLKIGDGKNGWNALSYINNVSDGLKISEPIGPTGPAGQTIVFIGITGSCSTGYQNTHSLRVLNTGNYVVGESLLDGSQGVNVLTFSNLPKFGLYTFMWTNNSQSMPFSGNGSMTCFYTDGIGFTGGYTTGQAQGVQVICRGFNIIILNYGDPMELMCYMIAHN
jgi:hypothetical protein